jgi:amino-acid N-acetyltransferase
MFGGEAVASKDLRTLLYDVALLHSLGVRVVLVAGARPQIDEALARRGAQPRFEGDLRVTDDVALQCVKEAVGATRVELEALLSMGLPNSPMAGARLRVATGNFVMAQPVGVVDGVDYQYTGKPRRVDADAIRQRLDDGAIVVLTPIGYSATGEAFNISSHDVAAATATALGADKLIGLLEGEGVLNAEGLPPSSPRTRPSRSCGRVAILVTMWSATWPPPFRPVEEGCHARIWLRGKATVRSSASSSRATGSARWSPPRRSKGFARLLKVTLAGFLR